MDIATLLGLTTGVGLVLGAIFMGGSLLQFMDPPAVMIVVGGTLAAICVSHPLEEVVQAFKAGFKIFASRKVTAQEVVNVMVRIADISRREGLLALEKIRTDNMVLKKACKLIADNAGPQLIQDTLRIEIHSLRRRHQIGETVFKSLGTFSPAFGLIGTLIGLVQMLARLENPKTLGPAMAVALLTTFYGALLANLVFLPVAGKLRARTQQELLNLEIIFEGARCILQNNNPVLVRDKLSSFVPPKERTYGG
ncbi:motility protein A [Fundidesulfovibrio agrisoli]|uniref:motility protein A n=1 Tax=Fundidesulfovibrio agrisoli TaxID=2922717 RepID=UPI001FADBCEA|nr:MotA/TolQ/ExbB proton channel family protein [Fundidesulfovibrio agrisoli]